MIVKGEEDKDKHRSLSAKANIELRDSLMAPILSNRHQAKAALTLPPYGSIKRRLLRKSRKSAAAKLAAVDGAVSPPRVRWPVWVMIARHDVFPLVSYRHAWARIE